MVSKLWHPPVLAHKELVSQALENILGGDSFCIVLFEFHSASFGMELSVILLPQ